MITREKLYRFIFVESRFEPTLLILFALVLISGLETAGIFYLKGQIKEAKTHKALIAFVPEMEDILYPQARNATMAATPKVQPTKIGENVYILKGVQQINHKPAALINDNIYQEGDLIEDYRVTKITASSVLLKQIRTGEMKFLSLAY